MKRIFYFLLLFLIFTGALAANDSLAPATYRWNDKLKRGALNIVSSPVEIARDIQITSNEENLLKGWTIGLLKGVGEGLLRFGAGVIDVVTCPFDFPDANKGPLIQPEYVWEKQGLKYS